MNSPATGVLAGALLTWLLLAALIPLLRRRLLDQPNPRSSHRTPTPRGGGVAFVVVGTLLCAVLEVPGAQSGSWFPWIPLVCCPLALVGMLDDRFDLPAGLRYGAQALTAVALLAVAATPVPWWFLPIALVAITAVVNFVNFMDGLDGLVAGCCAVLFAVAGLWPMVGALLGFLLWNWSPARVFMGDVGSTFLGALFAGVVLQQPSSSSALSLLLVGFPLLADACICVLRRLGAGQPVLQAHRLHLFQRLQQAGWSHARVALLYGGATGLLAAARHWGGMAGLLALVAVELLLGIWLDRHLAVPFAASCSDQCKVTTDDRESFGVEERS
jgi:Fuc2NAc and GlcNAc transferase